MRQPLLSYNLGCPSSHYNLLWSHMSGQDPMTSSTLLRQVRISSEAKVNGARRSPSLWGKRTQTHQAQPRPHPLLEKSLGWEPAEQPQTCPDELHTRRKNNVCPRAAKYSSFFFFLNLIGHARRQKRRACSERTKQVGQATEWSPSYTLPTSLPLTPEAPQSPQYENPPWTSEIIVTGQHPAHLSYLWNPVSIHFFMLFKLSRRALSTVQKINKIFVILVCWAKPSLLPSQPCGNQFSADVTNASGHAAAADRACCDAW